MAWKPISKDALLALIEAAEIAMAPPVLAFWKRICVVPVKWQSPPWGDLGSGFWLVAIVGQECIWYNDIEGGFNICRFETFGEIANYRCCQSDLEPCIRGYFECFMHTLGGTAQLRATADRCGK